jgi:glutathione-regulated potassium-efflux system ancillary protein KefF
MILIITAHPYPQRSRACKAMLKTVSALPDVEIRALYDLYPDFDIDVQAEQAALMRADIVVWLHPIYWYSVPAMLKHYFDVVLTHGWAYGEAHGVAGRALVNKKCLWVTTTGGAESSYTAGGAHQMPFDAFEAPVRQTALFCGMAWLKPLTLHGAHIVNDEETQAVANEFRARLLQEATPQLKDSNAH